MKIFDHHFTASQIILSGFAAVILAGAFFLMLPFSTASGQPASFSDALFTAVSSVCVTGLVVRDTGTYWSAFGQTVILVLIQIGGMGVITSASVISVFSGKQMDLRHRSTLQSSLSAPNVGGIVSLTGFIIKTAAVLELLGACILTPYFSGLFGFPKGMFYALFHSVSAFCNAGFDLMGSFGEFSSLTSVYDSAVVSLCLIFLIIAGGIGFLTWDDIRQHQLHFRKYRMQSKVILSVTALLIIFPALYMYIFEFSSFPFRERLLLSLFQSVTPRTAGFNTADLNAMSAAGLGIIMILMLTGGSPGSTAGGMKTTTLAVLLSTALSVFRRREHTNFFGRRIDENAVRTALTVLTMYIVLFLTGSFILFHADNISFGACLFEAASALGTAGLSLGITPRLSSISRTVLIFLMYIGRVGGLTLIFAAVNDGHRVSSRLPEENITIG